MKGRANDARRSGGGSQGEGEGMEERKEKGVEGVSWSSCNSSCRFGFGVIPDCGCGNLFKLNAHSVHTDLCTSDHFFHGPRTIIELQLHYYGIALNIGTYFQRG